MSDFNHEDYPVVCYEDPYHLIRSSCVDESTSISSEALGQLTEAHVNLLGECDLDEVSDASIGYGDIMVGEYLQATCVRTVSVRNNGISRDLLVLTLAEDGGRTIMAQALARRPDVLEENLLRESIQRLGLAPWISQSEIDWLSAVCDGTKEWDEALLEFTIDDLIKRSIRPPTMYLHYKMQKNFVNGTQISGGSTFTEVEFNNHNHRHDEITRIALTTEGGVDYLYSRSKDGARQLLIRPADESLELMLAAGVEDPRRMALNAMNHARLVRGRECYEPTEAGLEAFTYEILQALASGHASQ